MIQWNDNWIKRVEKRFGQRVEAAAIHLQNRVRENVSIPSRTVTLVDKGNGKGVRKVLGARGSNPSKPGEFFHKDTGFTRAHIAHDFTEETMTSRVGSPYAVLKFLELGTSKMRPRKGLRATLAEEKGNIRQIIEHGGTSDITVS